MIVFSGYEQFLKKKLLFIIDEKCYKTFSLTFYDAVFCCSCKCCKFITFDLIIPEFTVITFHCFYGTVSEWKKHGGGGGRDRMVVESRSWRDPWLDTTLCDKICQWLAAGRWFSPGTPVSSANKTDRHDITEKLLKMALNTITLTSPFLLLLSMYWNFSNYLHALIWIYFQMFMKYILVKQI